MAISFSEDLGILGKIGNSTIRRVEAMKTVTPVEKLKRQGDQFHPKDIISHFKRNGAPKIIAEVKLASPSIGTISNLNPVEVAADYLTSGASALSVLTEPEYFQGDIKYLSAIRKKFPESYLLMKDFFVDTYQLYQAKAIGADAILIIMALLGQERALEMLTQAKSLGLTPLVEVHNREELEMALAIDAPVIGINNRNLKDLSISISTSLELIKGITGDRLLISESGISSSKEINTLTSAGFHGFLVGTSLMATGTPGKALDALLNG